MQRSAAGACHKSGWQVTNTGFYVKAGVAERFCNPGAGFLFLKTKLGVGVNTMTQSNQVILSLRESFLRAGLRIHTVLLH